MKLNTQQEINIDGQYLKIAIILPYFNDQIGVQLLENANQELLNNGVKSENIEVIRTAGALEIPFACKRIIEKRKPDAIITLGVVIRGETTHYELVTENVYKGIMDLQLQTDTPIAFGVLSCENEEQAIERASAEGLNKGKEAAQTALLQTII